MHPPARVPLYVVDAFAVRPFQGNPAAVCLLEAWPEDAWLASVAAEMKHSETAYLVPAGKGYELRWFTPAVEVDLCGHATLASAFVLWESGRVTAGQAISFSTRSGTLVARGGPGLIELEFPLTRQSEASPPAGLLEALGCQARYVGRSRFDYLVEVDSEAALAAVAPDFRKLADVDCRGVIVTCRGARDEFDFVSRFFAPAAGVDEDPVTGSAHCTLAHYWGERLRKDELRAYQASKRGGRVDVAVQGDRVLLRGRAVMTVEGQLLCGG
ncbi:MAG: PhzF family phenazine biosynthesis protein [Planctomycetota bacterium]|nr:MAG: PhzF family phenazine biosynthesis protein [Planctomycetota bacterium]